LRFAGQYYDQETNNYYNYFRDYDPTTGRYLQSDPIGVDGGINTYTYVTGNPINKVDIYGLSSKSCCNQSWSECTQKCMNIRIGDAKEAAWKVWAWGVAATTAVTHVTYRSPFGFSVRGPAAGVYMRMVGRAVGRAFGSVVVGGAIGGAIGRGAIVGAAVGVAASAGYVVGSLIYCSSVCNSDSCNY
jgi:RHS repeat-associated protein